MKKLLKKGAAIFAAASLICLSVPAQAIAEETVETENETVVLVADEQENEIQITDIEPMIEAEESEIEDSPQIVSEDDSAEENEETGSTAKDAHFFVRYDNSNQEESGSSHYSPTKYFPIGTVADGYKYGSGTSDYTSPDGTVNTTTAYVSGAEGLITEAQINLYNSFNAEKDSIKTVFQVVYDDIVTSPSRDLVSWSIGQALGSEWKARYDNGMIDILWYVVKDGGAGYTNVDGVLYYIKSGTVIDKNDPEPDPEPEPEPTPDPEPEPTPITPDADSESDSVEPSESKSEEIVIEDNEVPLTKALPQTGDKDVTDTIILILVLAALVLTLISLVIEKWNHRHCKHK